MRGWMDVASKCTVQRALQADGGRQDRWMDGQGVMDVGSEDCTGGWKGVCLDGVGRWMLVVAWSPCSKEQGSTGHWASQENRCFGLIKQTFPAARVKEHKQA